MNTTALDYEGLLKLLPRLNRFPDATGETTLTPAEAAEIRALGFWAGPGKWNIPFVPFEFVRHTVFEWAARQPREDSGGAVPQKGTIERDDVEQPRQVSGAEGLSRLGQRMIRAVGKAGGRIRKRHLQKKFWRAHAKEFRRSLSEVVQAGFLRMEGQSFVLLEAMTSPKPNLGERTHTQKVGGN